MARVFTQSDEHKRAFLQKIVDKQAAREQDVRDRIDAATPKFLHWALKPLATTIVRTKQRQHNDKGDRGEFSVGLHLWARLPNEWTVINDVVLEYRLGEYTQLDHIVIGRAGIFLIETKAWHGAVLLKQDQCFRKEANKWVKTGSPIQQNKIHQRRFRQWYNCHGLHRPLPPIEPVVVFTQATWLRVDQCSIPVLTPKQTTAYLNGASGHHLSEESIDSIVEKILTATPLHVTAKSEQPQQPLRDSATRPPSGHRFGAAQILQGTNQHGRKYVRIRGTQESAKKVWEQYGKPGQLSRDRFDEGVFFFYYD